MKDISKVTQQDTEKLLQAFRKWLDKAEITTIK